MTTPGKSEGVRSAADAASRVRDTLRQLSVQVATVLERWESVSERAVAEIAKLKRAAERECMCVCVCVFVCVCECVWLRPQPTAML